MEFRLGLLLSIGWLTFSAAAQAAPDYHLVGWLNLAIPGGGQLLLGDYALAGAQAALETSSFVAGYSLSAGSPMTLDGVPVRWPVPDGTVHDVSTQIYAQTLQEFGIKFHMVNVFNAYREAARDQKVEEGIDQHSTADLFLAPYQPEVLVDPWVWGALAVSAGVVIGKALYVTHGNNVTIGQINSRSEALYVFDQAVVIPVGSGAPEEMFYRGFLQNEFYHWERSPFFSVGLSSLLFTFSHASEDRLSAAITGIYEGALTHLDHGDLKRAIAYHFWADVLAGLTEWWIMRGAEGGDVSVPLAALRFDF